MFSKLCGNVGRLSVARMIYRRILIIVSDQGSDMFASALVMSLAGLLVIFFPDPNHVDNNDAINSSKHALLTNHKQKTMFLAKFKSGPWATHAGGAFKQVNTDPPALTLTSN